MASDQRRKRLNGVNVVGFSSREHYRKKKKMESPDNSLNPRTHISIEWDSNQKVVAEREQIGLSLRDLRPFVDSIPHRRNTLADVCVVPQEIFELENLSEVLSYEVWQTHLSEIEINFLRQFLPGGTDSEQVPQALLAGDNFHFGNPALEWGTSLCSGYLHPDAVRCKEQRLRGTRRGHSSVLQKYHYDMIDYLQKLKESWERCKDPEKDIVQKMRGKSRGETSRTNDSHQDLDQDLTAASVSCSWNDEDEKPCSSDNKNSSVLKTGELKKRSRISEKAVENEKYGNPSVALDNVLNVGAKARKEDKLPPKHSMQQTDGAKYMSYLRISKKQHQIVTSMKQSGKSIQSRSLHRILGNINKLDVQPYGVFEEEEQKKLHAHWLQLVKDLPAAFAIWQEMQSLKWEISKSLERDLKDKLNRWMQVEQKQFDENNLQEKEIVGPYSSDEDTVIEKHKSLIQNQNDAIAVDVEPNMEDSGDSSQSSAQDQSLLQDSSPYGGRKFDLKEVVQDTDSGPVSQPVPSSPAVSSASDGHDVKLYDMKHKSDSVPSSSENRPSQQFSSPSSAHDFKLKDLKEGAYSVPGSLLDQSLPQVSSVSGDHAFKLNDMDSIGKRCVSELENSSLAMSEPTRNENVTDIDSSCGGPFSFVGDVWPAVGNGRSYLDSNPRHQTYTSTSGGLSLVHPLGNGEQKACFINIQSGMQKDGRKNMLPRQSDDAPFGSFPDQDRSELLQSLFKGHRMVVHNQKQLQSLFKGHGMALHNQGLDFQASGEVLMDGGQFSGQFREQLPQMPQSPPLTQEQKRQNEVYMQENTAENIYYDGSRYLMPRQEHLCPGGAQNWNAGAMRMLAIPIQSEMNSGEILNQNWLSGEHQLRSMWTGSSGAGVRNEGIQSDQSLHRGSNSDQTLLSVLSQCNQLQSRTPYNSVSSNEQFIAPRNYGMMMDGGMSRISSSLPQAAHPLDYLGGGNPTTSLMPNDVGGINQPHQNSALHDPLGKLYPRSWNH